MWRSLPLGSIAYRRPLSSFFFRAFYDAHLTSGTRCSTGRRLSSRRVTPLTCSVKVQNSPAQLAQWACLPSHLPLVASFRNDAQRSRRTVTQPFPHIVEAQAALRCPHISKLYRRKRVAATACHIRAPLQQVEPIHRALSQPWQCQAAPFWRLLGARRRHD